MLLRNIVATHFSDPKVVALQTAIDARDPFCSGICTIPEHQRLLYFNDGSLVRRIDVSNTSANDLDALYRACQPAEFGRSGESVLDDSYRKAGKMGLESFATLFDPRSLGIHEEISNALLTDERGMMNLELYKLNIYGQGDFFKAHKDTPRDQNMFGSLVVVLPTPHEGGQLVLRQDASEKEWTLDFADEFANAKDASACYVAFCSDIEHEVLPVTSGYRVTLTYSLYRVPAESATLPIPTPQHLQLKQTLVDLANDQSVLPNGGYLGFGLVHEYAHKEHNILEPLLDQLKGSDRVLADVCDELGLRCTLRMLYRGIMFDSSGPGLNLITTKELDIPSKGIDYEECGFDQQIERALENLTIEEVEMVDLVGNPDGFSAQYLEEEWRFLVSQFCKNPPTQVMEITRMKSSVDSTTRFMTYGNEPDMGYCYGSACMLVTVESVASRQHLVV